MANQDMSEAKNALDQLSADPAARKLAEDRILWDWAYRTDMAHEQELGLRKGRQDGLRDAVRTACRACDIELTDDRTKRLEAATDAELDSLLAALVRDRSWPE